MVSNNNLVNIITNPKDAAAQFMEDMKPPENIVVTVTSSSGAQIRFSPPYDDAGLAAIKRTVTTLVNSFKNRMAFQEYGHLSLETVAKAGAMSAMSEGGLTEDPAMTQEMAIRFAATNAVAFEGLSQQLDAATATVYNVAVNQGVEQAKNESSETSHGETA